LLRGKSISPCGKFILLRGKSILPRGKLILPRGVFGVRFGQREKTRMFHVHVLEKGLHLSRFIKKQKDMDKDTLARNFREMHGKMPEAIYFAPGRVNLIGDHTEYNGGYVFPCALTFGTFLAVARRGDGLSSFTSLNFPRATAWDAGVFDGKTPGTWERYPLGVAREFARAGHDPFGYDMLFHGDVPDGAGLSSSAAIEVVTATMLDDVLHAGLSRVEIAKLCQRAENEYVGMNSGIMDQFASAMGKEGHAIALDCKRLVHEWVPLEMEGVSLVIANTNRKRELSGSKYNERRAECEEAARVLAGATGRPLEWLCELGVEEFERVGGAIADPVIFRRARHAVHENARVLEAIETLKAGELARFGELMNASHRSLATDYEVTGKELDALVEEAWRQPGVLGSRMTGAGFGGCTVSLVETGAVPAFVKRVGEGYARRVGLTADFHVAGVGGGASRVM
jgi:galactokinase